MWAAAWMTLVAYSIMALAARHYTIKLFPGSLEGARILRLVGVFAAVFAVNWGVNLLDLSLWLSIASKLLVFALAAGSMLWLDIISVSEARSLLQRVGNRRRRQRTAEEDGSLIASEETLDGAMPDDTGFGQGR
jgi:hypothetical protein